MLGVSERRYHLFEQEYEKTEIRFPEHFSVEQKPRIIDSISHCAAKEIVVDGAGIDSQIAAA